MVMKTFDCKVLRGDEVTSHIPVSALDFDPQWGYSRKEQSLGISPNDGNLSTANVFIGANGANPILVEVEADNCNNELVLVQEYSPGVGAKRWPAFRVIFDDWGDEIRLLSQASTSKGSGWETHSLVIAPLGWAVSVAQQFYNERDVGEQVIGRPEEKPISTADGGFRQFDLIVDIE